MTIRRVITSSDVVVRERDSKNIIDTFATIESMRLYMPTYNVPMEYAVIFTTIDVSLLYSYTTEQFNIYFRELLIEQSKDAIFKKLF